MKVYFIRHGQSMTNLEDRVSGWIQCSLSELGFKQAEALESVLRNIKFDKIYSSDLLRAIQTAKTAIPGCEPEQTPLIREEGTGTATGVLGSELIAKYGDLYYEALRNNDSSMFGGENHEMVYERTAKFMKVLEGLEGYDKVAVFGHEGTIHPMLEYVLGERFLLGKIKINNCSISVFSYENGAWKLERFGWQPDIG